MTRFNFLKKIASQKQAQVTCKREKKKKLKIVFTNGCFDILHPGHVLYLEQARNKGDFLVVALDTDAAVRKLKGPSRPVNNLKSRQEVVAALESVSLVTYFDGGNPTEIIKKLKPDVLVKGGDWKIKDILGSKEVLGWGGKVLSLTFIEGRSTTKIVEKIISKKN